MIEVLVPIIIPNVGAYNTGNKVELDAELEKQLVRSEKAIWVGEPPETEEPADRIVPPPQMVEPGLTDD